MRWRTSLLASVVLGLCPSVEAQNLPPAAAAGVGPPGVHLELTMEQTKLLVDTITAIGCQNVGQLVMCLEAAKLRAEIQRQAAEQLK